MVHYVLWWPMTFEKLSSTTRWNKIYLVKIDSHLLRSSCQKVSARRSMSNSVIYCYLKLADYIKILSIVPKCQFRPYICEIQYICTLYVHRIYLCTLKFVIVTISQTPWIFRLPYKFKKSFWCLWYCHYHNLKIPRKKHPQKAVQYHRHRWYI